MNNLASYQHQKNMTHKVNLHTKLLHNIGPANNTVMEESNKEKKEKEKTTQNKPKKKQMYFLTGQCNNLLNPSVADNPHFKLNSFSVVLM